GISCTSGGATVLIGTGQGGLFSQNATAGYDPGDDTVKVTVAAGDTPTCTFTNTKHGSLKILKNTVGGNAAFLFTGDLGNFGITTAGGPPGTGSYGPVDLPASQLGTKQITESALTGWDVTGIACSYTTGTS